MTPIERSSTGSARERFSSAGTSPFSMRAYGQVAPEYVGWVTGSEVQGEGAFWLATQSGSGKKRAVFGSSSEESTTLRSQFQELARRWERETAFVSDPAEMYTHPAYQRIIQMGNRALPLIFEQLERRPNHWFWALQEITGANPVEEEHRGRLHEMANDWLEWWRQHPDS